MERFFEKVPQAGLPAPASSRILSQPDFPQLLPRDRPNLEELRMSEWRVQESKTRTEKGQSVAGAVLMSDFVNQA
jgi:hypothetical protein